MRPPRPGMVREVRTRWSVCAIAGFVLAVPIFVAPAMLAVPLSLAGLYRARGRRRRGAALARKGLFLGLVAVAINLSGCPLAVVPPPVTSRDRDFRAFLDHLASGRLEGLRAGVGPANAPEDDPALMRWLEAFNEHHGRGRLIWPALMTVFADNGQIYYVHFEKTGMHTLHMACEPFDDTWIVFLPSPYPGEHRFRDPGQDASPSAAMSIQRP